MNTRKNKIFLSAGVSAKILISLCLIFSIMIFMLGCNSATENPDKIDVGEKDTLNQQQEEKPEVTPEQNTEEQEGETEEEEQEEEAEEAKEDDEEEDEKEEPQSVTTTIYYADSTVQYLVGEDRIISNAHKYLSAFMELLKPPLEPGHIRLVSETTKVNRISYSDGNILLDLSPEFVEDRFKSDAVDVLLVYSIVNTFTEFAEVNTVTFYIDGERLNTIGQLDISNSLFRDSSWIKDN